MKGCILYLLLIFQLSALAQVSHGIIIGNVFDNETKEPLPGVNVIYRGKISVFTDVEGNFLLEINAKEIEIAYKCIGYKTFKQKVQVKKNDTAFVSVALTLLTNELNEVIVSANKSEQKISDITVSISVIKPANITNNHIVNAEDIAEQTSGIEVMDGQASIRGGSGYSYGAGSRVLALIDGLPVLADDASNIRWQFMPLENLAQIEVIKGASSVLYGSSALNGVINFRTDEAGNKPKTKFSAQSGIFDKPQQKKWVWWDSPRMYSNINFSHLKKYGKNTSIGIGSNFLFDNGYRKLNEEKVGRINFNIKRYSPKISQLNYGINLNLGYNIKHDFILWENADSGALKQNEETAIELNSLFYTVSPFISFKQKGRYSHDLKTQLQSTKNKFPENSQNNSNSISHYTEYQYYLNLFKQLDITLGASHRYSKIISEFYGDHDGNNLAGYSQITFKPLEKLKINGGIRIEQNSRDGKNDKIVPIFRSGINYQLSDYSFLRASFGQGYRYPSIAEKHAYTTLGAVKIIPNTEIEAESGWSSEIGYMQGLLFEGISGKIDFAAFYSESENMIEYIFGLYADPVTQVVDFGFMATNVEDSKVYGLETEVLLNKKLGKTEFTLMGGYTYMYPIEDSRVSEDKTIYLKYRRKHSAMAYLGVNTGKFETGLRLIYKSKMLNVDNVFIDPLTSESILPGFADYWETKNSWHLVLNLNIAYQLNPKLKLSLQIKNLSNEEYMGRPGDIAPHRFYSLMVSGRF